MVVIAIIAILASLLLPALGRAKRQARKAKCSFNLRQIGIAVHLYTSDYADAFPYSGRVWPEMSFVDVWRLLNPYVKTNNLGLFQCPADRGKGANLEVLIYWGNQFQGLSTKDLSFPNSYIYYAQFYCEDSANSPRLRRVGEVGYPAQKAICACFASAPGKPFGVIINAVSQIPPDTGHGTNGLSLLFVDGRSEFARFTRLNTTYQPGAYNLDWTVGGLRSGKDLKDLK